MMKQRYYIVLFVFLLSCSKEKLQTVYIASKGKKYFHAKGCRLQGNNKEAIGINDAISANYKACKFCKSSYKKVKNKKYKQTFSTSEEELQTVYIASKGKKYFHAKGCRLQGNNKEAIGINDAISANYKACKFCKPSYKKAENKKYKRSFSAKKSTSVKCSARTKKESRCSRKTRSSSGRCYQH